MRNVEDFDTHGLGTRISKSPKRRDGVRPESAGLPHISPDLGVYGLGQIGIGCFYGRDSN